MDKRQEIPQWADCRKDCHNARSCLSMFTTCGYSFGFVHHSDAKMMNGRRRPHGKRSSMWDCFELIEKCTTENNCSERGSQYKDCKAKFLSWRKWLLNILKKLILASRASSKNPKKFSILARIYFSSDLFIARTNLSEPQSKSVLLCLKSNIWDKIRL